MINHGSWLYWDRVKCLRKVNYETKKLSKYECVKFCRFSDIKCFQWPSTYKRTISSRNTDLLFIVFFFCWSVLVFAHYISSPYIILLVSDIYFLKKSKDKYYVLKCIRSNHVMLLKTLNTLFFLYNSGLFTMHE